MPGPEDVWRWWINQDKSGHREIDRILCRSSRHGPAAAASRRSFPVPAAFARQMAASDNQASWPSPPDLVGCLPFGGGFPIADRLDFGLPTAGRDNVADAFSEHGFRKRRDVRDRALGGIGFVFADDPERLLPAVVAPDGYPGAEPYFRSVGLGCPH